MKLSTQQNNVIIAIVRSGYPRTANGISDELGIPAPSVRRTVGQLKAQGFPIVSYKGTWGIEYKLQRVSRG